MADAKALEVTILNQKGVVFSGVCQVLFVPIKNKDELAILPYHTPLISLLGIGEVSIVTDGNKKMVSKTMGGVIYTSENKASVLITDQS